MDSRLSEWKELGTAAISDALDRLGISGQCDGIFPLDRAFQIAGPAFTVQMLPAGITGKSVGDFVDNVPSDSIIVIDNGRRTDVTVWGDLLTATAYRRGIGGTVIDGVCRDVGGALQISYPLFSRGVFMRTGKDRVATENVNVPVALGNIRVDPGDWIVGDADGVVVIPREKTAEVFAEARIIYETEERIRILVKAGYPLVEARDKHSYHRLQRPSKRSIRI